MNVSTGKDTVGRARACSVPTGWEHAGVFTSRRWYKAVRGVCVLSLQDLLSYKAVRVGGGGEWRTCATRDDEPLSRGLGTREEPGTLTQGACFPWLGEFFFAALDSWAGINPNLPGPYLEGPHLPIPVPCV